MVRLAMQEGKLTTGRSAGGRGAWMCPRIECYELADKRRAIPRSLRTEVPFEALEELRATIIDGTAFPFDGSYVKR